MKNEIKTRVIYLLTMVVLIASITTTGSITTSNAQSNTNTEMFTITQQNIDAQNENITKFVEDFANNFQKK